MKVKNNDEIGIVVRVPPGQESSEESMTKENSRLELGYIFRDSK